MEPRLRNSFTLTLTTFLTFCLPVTHSAVHEYHYGQFILTLFTFCTEVTEKLDITNTQVDISI